MRRVNMQRANNTENRPLANNDNREWTNKKKTCSNNRLPSLSDQRNNFSLLLTVEFVGS